MFSCEFCKIFKNTFFHRTPPAAVSEKLKAEAVIRRCSVKKVFLEIFLNSQGSTFARVSFLQPQECYVIKIESLTQAFTCEFYKYLSKNTFVNRTHPLVAPVKVCNFTNIRLRHGCIFANFLKLFETYLDVLLEFSKSSQKYWQKNIC